MARGAAAREGGAVRPIRDGVHFTRPPDLRHGRQDLDAAAVLAVQRERCLIAVTELLAALGYRGFGVRDVAGHARLSLAAFYACFPDKDAAVLEGYDRFVAGVTRRFLDDLAPAPTWEATVSSALRAYVVAVGADPVCARAYQVEVDALGAEARSRRRTALHRLAAFLRSQQRAMDPAATAIPLTAYVTAVHGVRQLISDVVATTPDAGLDAALADLVDEVGPAAARMFALPRER